MKIKIFGTIIVLVVCGLLGWWAYTTQFGTKVETRPLSTVPTSTAPLVTPELYQQTARQALAPYFAVGITNAEAISDLHLDMIRRVKKEVVALRVPKEYTSLHLQLALAFTNLEQGLITTDRQLITQGWAAINQAQSQYGWLR